MLESKILKRMWWALWRPFVKLGLRFMPLDDPWQRFRTFIPNHSFGEGSIHDFRWYFEGPSAVEATTVDAVCDWLVKCRYARDVDLFQTSDLWQHPTEFERRRAGDCEDHALWAWRKLTELGINAELVSGECLLSDGTWGRHVWVCFERDGETYLLEAVAKHRTNMILPLATVKKSYIPHMSIDNQFRRHGFEGYLHALKREWEGHDGGKGGT